MQGVVVAIQNQQATLRTYHFPSNTMDSAQTTSPDYKIDQFLNNDDRILYRVIWNDGETSDKMVQDGFATKAEADEFARLVGSCVPGDDIEEATHEISPGPWVLERTAMQFVIKAPKNDEDYLHKVVAVTAGLQNNNEANARLIAAAPDLLEALNYLLEQTVDMDLAHSIELTEGEQEARKQALAAIAKAS
jgi:hypothetical protein